MSGSEKRVIWQTTTLMCDECHRESGELPVTEDLIGKQCRWCEADMLSQKEYDDFYVPPKRLVDRINRWLGWIPFLTCTEDNAPAEVTMKRK